MTTENDVRNVVDLIWREDLYPRIEPDPATIQKYAADLELCPPVEINQHNEIIDGYHRWTAYRKNDIATIPVTVTHTASDVELLALACKRNSRHGLQLSGDDKERMAKRLFNGGVGMAEDAIADALSVKRSTVMAYLARIKKDLKHERDRKIADMWLACHTEEEIAEAVGCDIATVSREVSEPCKMESIEKCKILSLYQEPEWTPPLYNIWKQQEKTNKVNHFGNSEANFVDRLLYHYTQPFDIVVDPFAGGGSTIDVCKRRLRRYWVSDRKPIVERRDIREWDITSGPPPLHKRWSDARLVYLDPPYWKQAEGQYSKDESDLANMPLELFTKTLVGCVHSFAEKLKAGAKIALIMQPTQWKAPERQCIDHVADAIKLVKLPIWRRFSVPYESQQCNAQMVDWAKENRESLVLTREIVVWQVAP